MTYDIQEQIYDQLRSDPAAAMRQLRSTMLKANPAEFGFQPTVDFPDVYGAVAEFPIGDNIATVVAMRDGAASLYTTTTFGVIGGEGHDSVRQAASSFVYEAQKSYSDAGEANDFPYPQQGRIRFYLLTFTGARFLEADMESVESGYDDYSALFARANEVLTELRLVTEGE